MILWFLKKLQVDLPNYQIIVLKSTSIKSIGMLEEFVFENVFFDFDSFKLKQESLSSLRRLERFLRVNPSVSILVTGHTDTIGSDEYNFKLSLQRAKSVQFYLETVGIASNRVKVAGMGSREPLLPNTSKANQAKNRRITIEIN